MKFRAEYIIPMVILFFVILISLCDSCMYFMPYDPEGFDNISIPLGTTIFESSNNKNNGKNFPASAPIQTTNENQEGFDVLQNYSAEYGTEKSIEIYSQASGDLKCEASPYSNSMGYLCMDKNQKQALQTRGYNQTGGDMQIGQA
jgi:hypothetical protein